MDRQRKDDKAQSLWEGFIPVALFVCGAILLGYICGHAGGSLLVPCPMGVGGGFAEEGSLIGIILGAVVGIRLVGRRLAGRVDQPGSLPEPRAESDTEAPTEPKGPRTAELLEGDDYG